MKIDSDFTFGDVAIVCHDTGAANALSSFVRHFKTPYDRPAVICTGYAADVFRKAGIIHLKEFDREPKKKEIEILFDELKPKAVLTGTSFDSWVERWFCQRAVDQGIFCIAFVDWWSNFGRRFSTPGSDDLYYLPNAIAVTDEDARNGCIDDGIPEKLLHITGNPYWDFLVGQTQDVRIQIGSRFREQLRIDKETLLGLIISSNIRNLNLNIGYDERDFLESIIPLPDFTAKGEEIKWAIKPHPTESVDELAKMLFSLGIDMPIVERASGPEAILGSDFVLGMCSSLLFEAALMGKKIISLQPGLDMDKLKYLRIFDYLGVPKIIKTADIKDVIKRLVNSLIPVPNLNDLTFTVGKNYAFRAISHLLLCYREVRDKREPFYLNMKGY